MPVHREVNRDFFKHWSSEMAYILGLFMADGNLTINNRGGCYISFHLSDKELLVLIRQIMGSTHRIAKRTSNSGRVFRLQIGSKGLTNDLIRLGLGPGKTNRLKLPLIPEQYFGDFIRGYFDGDGNVWVGETNKDRRLPTKVIQISLTSGCNEFLKDLLKELRKNGVSGGSFFRVKNKNCFRLSFSTVDVLKIYKIMYNSSSSLFLERKKDVL